MSFDANKFHDQLVRAANTLHDNKEISDRRYARLLLVASDHDKCERLGRIMDARARHEGHGDGLGKIGDGTFLELLKKWWPWLQMILAFFGIVIPLPPLPASADDDGE